MTGYLVPGDRLAREDLDRFRTLTDSLGDPLAPLSAPAPTPAPDNLTAPHVPGPTLPSALPHPADYIPGAPSTPTAAPGPLSFQAPGFGFEPPRQDPTKSGLMDLVSPELGKPYGGPIVGQPDAMRWGPGWDCSSFVSAIFDKVGVKLTPYTDAAINQLQRLRAGDEPQPGDVFFTSGYDDGQRATYKHMGIYLGNGEIVDASYGRGVTVRPVAELKGTVTWTRAPGASAAFGKRALQATAATMPAATQTMARVGQPQTIGTPTSATPSIEGGLPQDGTRPGAAVSRPTIEPGLPQEGTKRRLMDLGDNLGSAFGADGGRAVQAVLQTEGGMTGAIGDTDLHPIGSHGPLQFFGGGGQLDNFARAFGMSLEQAGRFVRENPEKAIAWAIGTPEQPGYLGAALKKGIAQGLRGAELATFIQRTGQVSKAPERAGANYNALFGGLTSSGAPMLDAGGPPGGPGGGDDDRRRREDLASAFMRGSQQLGETLGGLADQGAQRARSSFLEMADRLGDPLAVLGAAAQQTPVRGIATAAGAVGAAAGAIGGAASDVARGMERGGQGVKGWTEQDAQDWWARIGNNLTPAAGAHQLANGTAPTDTFKTAADKEAAERRAKREKDQRDLVPSSFTPAEDDFLTRPTWEGLGRLIARTQAENEGAPAPVAGAKAVHAGFQAVGAPFFRGVEAVRDGLGKLVVASYGEDLPILKDIERNQGPDAAWDAGYRLLFDPEYGMWRNRPISEVEGLGGLARLNDLVTGKRDAELTVGQVMNAPAIKGIVEFGPLNLVGAARALLAGASREALLAGQTGVSRALGAAEGLVRITNVTAAGELGIPELFANATRLLTGTKGYKVGQTIRVGDDSAVIVTDTSRPDVLGVEDVATGQQYFIWRDRGTPTITTRPPKPGDVAPAGATAGGPGGLPSPRRALPSGPDEQGILRATVDGPRPGLPEYTPQQARGLVQRELEQIPTGERVRETQRDINNRKAQPGDAAERQALQAQPRWEFGGVDEIDAEGNTLGSYMVRHLERNEVEEDGSLSAAKPSSFAVASRDGQHRVVRWPPEIDEDSYAQRLVPVGERVFDDVDDARAAMLVLERIGADPARDTAEIERILANPYDVQVAQRLAARKSDGEPRDADDLSLDVDTTAQRTIDDEIRQRTVPPSVRGPYSGHRAPPLPTAGGATLPESLQRGGLRAVGSQSDADRLKALRAEEATLYPRLSPLSEKAMKGRLTPEEETELRQLWQRGDELVAEMRPLIQKVEQGEHLRGVDAKQLRQMIDHGSMDERDAARAEMNRRHDEFRAERESVGPAQSQERSVSSPTTEATKAEPSRRWEPRPLRAEGMEPVARAAANLLNAFEDKLGGKWTDKPSEAGRIGNEVAAFREALRQARSVHYASRGRDVPGDPAGYLENTKGELIVRAAEDYARRVGAEPTPKPAPTPRRTQAERDEINERAKARWGSDSGKFMRARAKVVGDEIEIDGHLRFEEGWPEERVTHTISRAAWEEAATSPNPHYERQRLLREAFRAELQGEQSNRWDRLLDNASNAIGKAFTNYGDAAQPATSQTVDGAKPMPPGWKVGDRVEGVHVGKYGTVVGPRRYGTGDGHDWHVMVKFDGDAEPIQWYVRTKQPASPALEAARTAWQERARAAAGKRIDFSDRPPETDADLVDAQPGTATVPARGADAQQPVQQPPADRGRAAAGPARGAGEQPPARAGEGRGPDRRPGTANPAGGVEPRAERPADPRGGQPGLPRNAGDAEPLAPSTNYRVTPADERFFESARPVERFAANVEAVRRVKDVERTGRPWTDADRQAFARFSGFGASAFNDAFPHSRASKPNARLVELGDQLRDLVGTDEYASIGKSRLNAHYTTPAVIHAMWRGLERLGIGNLPNLTILEPSAGSGRFFGLMPESLADRATLTGVELEMLTGTMLKVLYPEAYVHVMGFERVDVRAPGAIPDGSQDLVISNVPFGNYPVADPALAKGPKFLTGAIHNYFFVKALEKVRPGGVVAFVTSAFTLNARNGGELRRYLAQRAQLLGAIRLPQDAFPDTSVVTDVIFLRRHDGPLVEDVDAPWLHTDERSFDFKGEPKAVSINRYFLEHPEMVLGTHGVSGHTTTGVPDYVVLKDTDADIARQLAAAVKKLPDNVLQPATTRIESAETLATRKVMEGSYVERDGKLLVMAEGQLRPAGRFVERIKKGADGKPIMERVATGEIRGDLDGPRAAEAIRAFEDTGVIPEWARHYKERQAKERLWVGYTPDEVQRIRAMVTIHDLGRRVLDVQRAGRPEAEISRAQAELRRAYDTFVRANGPLNLQSNRTLFKDDTRSYWTLALETWSAKLAQVWQVAKEKRPAVTAERLAELRTPIFDQVLAGPDRAITSADTPKDALFVTLNEHGAINWPRMEALLGTKADAIAADLHRDGLIYRNPSADGKPWELADEYLSGDVKTKLEQARAAAATDPAYRANVEALQKVQPTDVPAGEIDVRLGSVWVPQDDLNAFIRETLFTPQYQSSGDVFHQVNVGPMLLWRPGSAFNTWRVDPEKRATWGTTDVHPLELVEHALTNKQVRVTRTVNGSEVLDEDATRAAQGRLQALRDEFVKWLWREPERAERLARQYNDEFNRVRNREWDGSHLQFSSTNPSIVLRDLQKSVVWRGMQTPTLLIAHEVGYGKTFSMAALAMEHRRLGLARRPMMVVPNHLVGQAAREWWNLYPTANLLVPSKADFEPAARATLMSRIATGDWDGIVLPVSQLKLLPLHPQTQIDFLQAEIRQIQEVIDAYAGATKGKKDRTHKELEKKKARMEAQVQSVVDRLAEYQNERAHSLTWDELGVDLLMVDEADQFKNLQFFTTRTRIKGLPNSKSDRAFDLYMKSRLLLQERGRGLVFATGTPVSNTIAEVWTMLRYLIPDTMEQMRLAAFDAWASVFGETVINYERTPTGEYRPVERFAKFGNLPELAALFQRVADIRMAEDSPEMQARKPHLLNGERTKVKSPKTEWHTAYVKQLLERSQNLKNVDPRIDNFLKLTSDARKASLDPQLVGGPDLPQGKVNLLVDKVVEIYRREAADRGTQLVFLDLGTPKSLDHDGSLKDLPKELRDEIARRKAEMGDEWDDADQGELIRLYYEQHGLGDPDEQRQIGDVYNRIKDKLVRAGIPRDEIAFIHDPKNDRERTALFDRVNDGDVRVLIGSTEKMGAGTNVQRRAAALHHLDTPWRPRDLEQREGRVLRQKNVVYGPPLDSSGEVLRDAEGNWRQGRGVEIVQYVTEWPFDSFQWSTLLAKARAIKSLMRRHVTERTVLDADEFLLDGEAIEAIATGDPMARLQVQLRDERRQLQAEQIDFRNRKGTAASQVKSLPSEIEDTTARIEQIRQDLATVKAQPEGFRVTVDKRTLTKRPEAGQALLDAAKRLADKNKGEIARSTIGGFAGLTLQADVGPAAFSLALTSGDVRYGTTAVQWAEASAQGIVARLEGVPRQVEQSLTAAEWRLKDLEQRLQGARNFLSAEFEHEGRLGVLERVIGMIDRRMSGEKKMQEINGAKQPVVTAEHPEGVPIFTDDEINALLDGPTLGMRDRAKKKPAAAPAVEAEASAPSTVDEPNLQTRADEFGGEPVDLGSIREEEPIDDDDDFLDGDFSAINKEASRQAAQAIKESKARGAALPDTDPRFQQAVAYVANGTNWQDGAERLRGARMRWRERGMSATEWANYLKDFAGDGGESSNRGWFDWRKGEGFTIDGGITNPRSVTFSWARIAKAVGQRLDAEASAPSTVAPAGGPGLIAPPDDVRWQTARRRWMPHHSDELGTVDNPEIFDAAAALLNKVDDVVLGQGKERGSDDRLGWMTNTAGARQFKAEADRFRDLWAAQLGKKKLTESLDDLLEDAKDFAQPVEIPVAPSIDDVFDRPGAPALSTRQAAGFRSGWADAHAGMAPRRGVDNQQHYDRGFEAALANGARPLDPGTGEPFAAPGPVRSWKGDDYRAVQTNPTPDDPKISRVAIWTIVKRPTGSDVPWRFTHTRAPSLTGAERLLDSIVKHPGERRTAIADLAPDAENGQNPRAGRPPARRAPNLSKGLRVEATVGGRTVRDAVGVPPAEPQVITDPDGLPSRTPRPRTNGTTEHRAIEAVPDDTLRVTFRAGGQHASADVPLADYRAAAAEDRVPLLLGLEELEPFIAASPDLATQAAERVARAIDKRIAEIDHERLRAEQPFQWHAYVDSEAPGVRRTGPEHDAIPYSSTDLATALEWSATVKWGAMRVEADGKGRPSDELLEQVRAEAARLGYELHDVYTGRGDRTWRFRVRRLQDTAPATSNGLVRTIATEIGEPSAEAVDAVNRVLHTLPPTVLERVTGKGITIDVIAGGIHNHPDVGGAPQDGVRGRYHAELRKVLLPQTSLVGFTAQPEILVLHELGHAVDHAYDSAGHYGYAWRALYKRHYADDQIAQQAGSRYEGQHLGSSHVEAFAYAFSRYVQNPAQLPDDVRAFFDDLFSESRAHLERTNDDAPGRRFGVDDPQPFVGQRLAIQTHKNDTLVWVTGTVERGWHPQEGFDLRGDDGRKYPKRFPAGARVLDDQPNSARARNLDAEAPAEQTAEPATTAASPTPPTPQAGTFEFASTQANLPPEIAEKVTRYQRLIDPEDLAGDGLEQQPHITVLYGLHEGVEISDVERVLASDGPISVTFGKNAAFDGDGTSVPLYVEVTSRDLDRINGKLSAVLPNTQTHPSYTPHVTIAYIKPEAVEKYVGEASPLTGTTATLDTIVFSGRDGAQTPVTLSGRQRNGASPTAVAAPPRPPAAPPHTNGVNGSGGQPPIRPPAPPATPAEPPEGEGTDQPIQHVVGFGYQQGTSDAEQQALQTAAAAYKEPRIGRDEIDRAATLLQLDSEGLERLRSLILAMPDGQLATESQALRTQAVGAVRAAMAFEREHLRVKRKLEADPGTPLTDAEKRALDESALAAVRAAVALDLKASRRFTNEIARALQQHKLAVNGQVAHRQYQQMDAVGKAAERAAEVLGKLERGDEITGDDVDTLSVAIETIETNGHILDGADPEVAKTTEALGGGIFEPDEHVEIPTLTGFSDEVTSALEKLDDSLIERAMELVKLNRQWRAARDRGEWGVVARVEAERQVLLQSIRDETEEIIRERLAKATEAQPATQEKLDRKWAAKILSQVRREVEEQLRFPNKPLDELAERINNRIRVAVAKQEMRAALKATQQGETLLDKAARAARIGREQSIARQEGRWNAVATLEADRTRLLEDLRAGLVEQQRERAEAAERRKTERGRPVDAAEAQQAIDEQAGRAIMAKILADIREAQRGGPRFNAELHEQLRRRILTGIEKQEISDLVTRLRGYAEQTFRPASAAQNLAGVREAIQQLEAVSAAGTERASKVRRALFKKGLERYLAKELPEDRLGELVTLLMTADADNPAQLSEILRSLRHPTTWDKLREYTIINMLMSPLTWGLTGVNIISNNAMIAGRVLGTMPLEVLHDRIRHGGDRSIFAGEIPHLLAGMREATPEAARLARAVWTSGTTPEAFQTAAEMGDLRAVRREYLSEEGVRFRKLFGPLNGKTAVPGWVFSWLHRISTRPLEAADVFQGHSLYAGMIESLAYREAEKRVRAGTERGDVEEVTRRIVRNIWDYPEILAKAGDVQQYTLFRAKPDRIFASIAAMRYAKPGSTRWRVLTAAGLHQMFPFMYVPYNWAKVGISTSPVGTVYHGARYFGESDPTEQARRFSHTMIGSLLLGFGLAFYLADNLTGDGPSDQGERRLWLDSHQPQSIRIPGTGIWLAHRGLPFSLQLSMVANFLDSWKEAARKQGGKLDAAGALNVIAAGAGGGVRGALLGVSDQTMLRTVGDTYEMIAGRRDGGSFIAGQLDRYIPASAMIAFLSRMGDSLQRESRSFTDRIAGRLPIRGMLRPQLDPLGRPIENNQRGLGAIVPFQPTVKDEDPVVREFARLDVNLPAAPDSVESVPLTADERHTYEKIAGPIVERATTKVMASKTWATLSDARKAKVLEEIRTDAREAAGAQIIKAMGRDEVRRRLLQTRRAA